MKRQNKKLLLIYIFAIVCFIINCKATSTNKNRPHMPDYTIAIMNVEYQSDEEINYSNITRDFIEEEFSRYPEYKIIDRINIDNIIKELSLESTGIIDVDVNRIGQMLKADRLLLSKLQKIDDIWILTGRLINVETGVIIKTSAGRVTKPSKLDGAAKGMSRRITDRIH